MARDGLTEQQLDGVLELVRHARKISPSAFMSVYVSDLERVLGLHENTAPRKTGMKDDE